MSPFGSQHARVGADGAQQLSDELGRSHERRGVVAQRADGRDADQALEIGPYLRHELAYTGTQISRWDGCHRPDYRPGEAMRAGDAVRGGAVLVRRAVLPAPARDTGTVLR